MQTASVVFDSCVGPVSVRICSSERMMDEAYEWLHRTRKRKGSCVPEGIDDFTLVMGYQAQIMLAADVAGRA